MVGLVYILRYRAKEQKTSWDTIKLVTILGYCLYVFVFFVLIFLSEMMGMKWDIFMWAVSRYDELFAFSFFAIPVVIGVIWYLAAIMTYMDEKGYDPGRMIEEIGVDRKG